VAVLGEATAAAEAALAAVEKEIDLFFTPPDDMPLVTEEPDAVLPLKSRLNPRHLEAVLDFAAKCVIPLLGERDELTRLEWKKVKAAFSPYREWVKSKPVMNAEAKTALDAEEKFLRFKLYLGEFIDNFVFIGLAFVGVYSVVDILVMIITHWILSLIWTAIAQPFTTMTVRWAEKGKPAEA
jgi:hypothetical protein